MAFDDIPVDRPGLRDWLRGNGYICREWLTRLARFNGGAALKHAQPHLAKLRFGPTPFEYDWDVLVVLDTCRPDTLAETGRDWLPDPIPTARSPASWSREWMKKSFGDEWAAEKAQTAHVTWNPFADHVLDADEWRLLDRVYNTEWDDENGWVSPEAVTDHAIAAARRYDPERLIVHYQQPHTPYRTIETERLTRERIGEVSAGRHTVWDRILDPDDPVTAADARAGHMDALQWALDSVETLLSNVDAERVLLTADHGECFGEWLVYGHGMGMPFPQLITVPHVWLSATDERTRKPEVAFDTDADGDVTERLAALGYT